MKIHNIPEQDIKPCSQGLMIKTNFGFILLEGNWVKEELKLICTITDGTKKWTLNGVLHRLDGPAIEYKGGNKEWYQNGRLHRKNGPAVEWKDGSRFWYQDGKIHREDGPAVEWASGSKSWFLNGKSQKFSETLDPHLL